MIRYLFIIFLLMTFKGGLAQHSTDYTNQLFFGILARTPDTTIVTFLTKYVPVLCRKLEPGGKWSAYPPGHFEEPNFKVVTNAYVFYKHPYFEAHFTSGQLEITQKIYNEEKWIDNIQDIKLWFDFDNSKDANDAYDKMVETFSKFGTLKRLSDKNGVKKAEFTERGSDEYYSNVQFILARDNFTEKGFRILFQIGNDLYSKIIHIPDVQVSDTTKSP